MEAEAARQSIPTEPQPTDISRQVRSRLVRRIFVVGLGLFLVLGALGFYGVRTRSASAAGGGYEVSVRYATVSRPGLATPWSVEVRRPGGFPDGLTLAVMSGYFDAFDENGLDPAPVEETSDGERTYWRFGPSAADTIAVSFDARIEPGVQATRVKGRVEVLDGPPGPQSAAVVTVDFGTWVMP
ncbi:MAG: hypothetical protein ACR2KK_21415 [Acidimicrobiales bacterium]